MTTITVIGDIPPEEAKPVFEKWFGGWKSAGAKPGVILPAVPANQPASVNVPDATQVQDSVELAQETRATDSVTYGSDPENVSKARLLVEQELAAMRTANVSPAELQQAKALLLRQ